MALKLNILVSTIDGGIEKIKNLILSPRNDVNYIVSHQYTDEKFKSIPDEIKRSDIFVSQIPGKGVTKSRNNAIRLANGDIGLFSDDDVTYTNEYFNKIIEVFTKNPINDVVVFKNYKFGRKIKNEKYPKEKIKLSQKLPFSIGTIEIAFRVNKIKEAEIYFDERFGAGQPLIIGADENIFVIDCIRKGLNAFFVPEYIVNHPSDATISKISKYDKRIVAVSGAYDARLNGIVAIPKAFGRTLKILPDLIKNNKNPFFYLLQTLEGVFHIYRNKVRNS